FSWGVSSSRAGVACPRTARPAPWRYARARPRTPSLRVLGRGESAFNMTGLKLHITTLSSGRLDQRNGCSRGPCPQLAEGDMARLSTAALWTRTLRRAVLNPAYT